MSLEGGGWIWSASLRFYWMLPIFLIIVGVRRNIRELILEMKKNLTQWVLWSTIGFGVFYASLTFAAAYSPSWLVASTWQVTIIAGMILSAFTNLSNIDKPPRLFSSLLFSGIILSGILIMQVSHAESFSLNSILFNILPVMVAAFAYPLGNRMMMHIIKGRLDVYQRILGMLISSMPFWLLLSGYELFANQTLPESGQYAQTFIVAISSGVVATVLFFSATDKVREDERSLAAVEATQSVEVLFALVGEIVLLHSSLPDVYALSGMALVVLGMALHSIKT